MASSKRVRVDNKMESNEHFMQALLQLVTTSSSNSTSTTSSSNIATMGLRLTDPVTLSLPHASRGLGCHRQDRSVTIRASVAPESLQLTPDLYTSPIRRLAVCDYLYRCFCESVATSLANNGTPFTITLPDMNNGKEQFILSRSCMSVSSENGTVQLDFPVSRAGWPHQDGFDATPSIGNYQSSAATFLQVVLTNIFSTWISVSQLNTPLATKHWQCVEDQHALREFLAQRQGICFVADGSILPRVGGNDDRVLPDAVPFITPSTLLAEFSLPHRGNITGMLVPKGITVITGGGYHGKSTILRAISFGAYDKVPHDGREFVVTSSSSIGIRSEDGRFVSGVNISPFIDNLPGAAAIDPRSFGSNSASGSTSMAANVIEFMELGPDLFLLDEDTCASNFMIRDSRMRSMIANEPITPFIYRVNSLYKQMGISTIVVIGGCGDWFDVQDTTIMMDNYRCLDMSKRARSISKTFCTGRVEFNGRGLVHQLPWPDPDDDEEFRGMYSTRHLLALPLSACGLTIDAADDGHSITFHWDESLSTSSRGVGEDRESARATAPVSVNVDLSKLEQRVVSQSGALGIALAVAFVAEAHRLGEGKQPQPHTLISLLRRFDNVKLMWQQQQQQQQLQQQQLDQGGGPTEHSDYRLVYELHQFSLSGREFVWPRPFESAAAVNRLRSARFSSKATSASFL